MSEKEQKNSEDISQHLTDELQKLEGSKILRKIEEIQADLKSQLHSVQNEIRNLITERTHQDELNAKLLSEIHQIGESLQKLESVHDHTNKMVSQQDKGLEENRQLIHNLEKEIQKIKSVLRVD